MITIVLVLASVCLLAVNSFAKQDGLETSGSFKARDHWSRGDVSGLTALAETLGSEWRGGLLILRDGVLEPIDRDRGLWAVPAPRWFA